MITPFMSFTVHKRTFFRKSGESRNADLDITKDFPKMSEIIRRIALAIVRGRRVGSTVAAEQGNERTLHRAGSASVLGSGQRGCLLQVGTILGLSGTIRR